MQKNLRVNKKISDAKNKWVKSQKQVAQNFIATWLSEMNSSLTLGAALAVEVA